MDFSGKTRQDIWHLPFVCFQVCCHFPRHPKRARHDWRSLKFIFFLMNFCCWNLLGCFPMALHPFERKSLFHKRCRSNFCPNKHEIWNSNEFIVNAKFSSDVRVQDWDLVDFLVDLMFQSRSWVFSWKSFSWRAFETNCTFWNWQWTTTVTLRRAINSNRKWKTTVWQKIDPNNVIAPPPKLFFGAGWIRSSRLESKDEERLVLTREHWQIFWTAVWLLFHVEARRSPVLRRKRRKQTALRFREIVNALDPAIMKMRLKCLILLEKVTVRQKSQVIHFLSAQKLRLILQIFHQTSNTQQFYVAQFWPKRRKFCDVCHSYLGNEASPWQRGWLLHEQHSKTKTFWNFNWFARKAQVWLQLQAPHGKEQGPAQAAANLIQIWQLVRQKARKQKKKIFCRKLWAPWVSEWKFTFNFMLSFHHLFFVSGGNFLTIHVIDISNAALVLMLCATGFKIFFCWQIFRKRSRRFCLPLTSGREPSMVTSPSFITWSGTVSRITRLKIFKQQSPRGTGTTGQKMQKKPGGSTTRSSQIQVSLLFLSFFVPVISAFSSFPWTATHFLSCSCSVAPLNRADQEVHRLEKWPRPPLASHWQCYQREVRRRPEWPLPGRCHHFRRLGSIAMFWFRSNEQNKKRPENWADTIQRHQGEKRMGDEKTSTQTKGLEELTSRQNFLHKEVGLEHWIWKATATQPGCCDWEKSDEAFHTSLEFDVK